MATVSHIGYVLITKNHLSYIEMTIQTHSDYFWSPVIACHVAANRFMFNQSQGAERTKPECPLIDWN